MKICEVCGAETEKITRGMCRKCYCHQHYIENKEKYLERNKAIPKDVLKQRKHEEYLRHKDKYLERSAKRQKEKKEDVLAKKKEWYHKNRDELLERRRERYEDGEKQANRERAEKNKEKYYVRRKQWHYEKMENDEVYAFKQRVRHLIRSCFKTKKNGNRAEIEEMLGCSIEEFVKHIQSQFKDGMTLENHGKWQIDHKIPLATAKTKEEVIKLCHYTNLQPLWADENLKKRDKI